jgi:tRNA(Ile)-lysidine synthase
MANSRKQVNLVEHVVALLGQHAVHGRHLALGLSGGMDSCVLLDLLVQAKLHIEFRLSVIHINHQISANSEQWEHFCADLSLHHRIPFTAIKVDVPRDSGLGLEAAAREARYQALSAQDCDMIALAHHQDDQSETFLLQLLRGAGINGLAAMPVSRHEHILRPLLDIPRSEILRYAQAQKLQWVEDESNINLHFDRNFLRQQIMPQLAKRFPGYRATLARTAEHIASAAALLEQVALEDARQAAKGSNGRQMDINVLRTFSSERAANMMRWWIREETGLILSTSRLQNITRQLCEAKANARIECKLEQKVLRRYRDMAYIVDAMDTQPYELTWRGENSLQLPGGDRLLFSQVLGQGIALTNVAEGLIVNNRRGNISLRTHSNRPTRSLKNLWQESGIPPWERDRTPLIWHGKELVAVPGLGIASDWQVASHEHGWLVELVRHH